jgi:hypothetical protein
MTEESLSLSESASLSGPIEFICPPLNEEFVPLDLSLASPKPFLERTGLLQAQQMPGPRMDPMKYKSHEIPLEAPQPNPEGLGYLLGIPSPDRGQSIPWPHGPRDAPS